MKSTEVTRLDEMQKSHCWIQLNIKDTVLYTMYT